MTNQIKRMAILVAVLMVTSGLALAMSATADHFDPKKDKKTHKDGNANKPTYVNLAFFGDHFISCPTASVPADVTVTVLDPTDGSTATSSGPHNVPVVGGTTVDPNTCLGGVSSTDNPDDTPDDPIQPAIPGSWQVWATDFVWNQNLALSVNNVLEIVCDSKGDDAVLPGPRCGEVGQDYLVTSGFATLEATVTQQKVKKGTGGVQILCAVDDTNGPWTGTDVCLNMPDDDITKTKRLTGFSFCGTGGVNDIDTTAWDKVKKEGNTDYSLTKAAFIDGTIFYLFDCGLGGLTEVRNTYNVIVAAWNTGAGVPGYNGEICQLLVCLFNFPAPGAKCWEPATSPNKDDDGDGIPDNDPDDGTKKQNTTTWSDDHLALPGIAGTVGWTHDVDPQTNLGCTEDVNEGNWLVQQGAFEVKVKAFPVVVE